MKLNSMLARGGPVGVDMQVSHMSGTVNVRIIVPEKCKIADGPLFRNNKLGLDTWWDFSFDLGPKSDI